MGDHPGVAAVTVRAAAPTPPWLERLPGDRYRFHAVGGGEYTIHDYRLKAGKRELLHFGHTRAEYRAFVPADRKRRVYRLAAGEGKKTDVFDLERQLAKAETLGTRHVPDRQPY